MFKPFQKFQSKLLEEIMDSRWAHFVSPNLTEEEKTNVLSTIIRTGNSRRGVSDPAAAAEWAEKTNRIIESITGLAKHCSRTTNPYLKKWISFCEKSVSSFKANPTKKLSDLLERQAFHSTTLLENVKQGKAVGGLAEELLRVMSGSVRMSLIENIVDHSKFIKGLEKEFDIDVVKYEPIRDGVFIYLDLDSTNKLNDVVANSNSYIERIADEFGYLLLRKGAVPNIEYGNFGENLSCWMFVYAPLTKEKEVGGDSEVLSKGFKTLKLSERWGH